MRRLAAAASLFLAALTLSGCGGGGEGESAPAPDVEVSGDGGARVAPLEVSGGGSAQFRVKGADNSIANYGSEAPPAELRAAAALAHGYLAALATEDWAGACARLSSKVVHGAERLAAAAPEFEGRGCAAALGVLFGAVSAAEGREASAMDAAALRREGGFGFLIYRGARGRAYFVKLTRESGGWAVDGLSPTPLG